MTDVYPTKLELVERNKLQITWSDSQTRVIGVQRLRDACPCASCREKRNAPASESNELPVLSIEETQPLQIVGMRPVGNYAYGIQFSDGHDTGIYTLSFLRELGDNSPGESA